MEGSDRRRRGAIAGGGERSQVEGERPQVDESDGRWRRVTACGEDNRGYTGTSVVSEGWTIEQARKSLQINTELDTGDGGIERGIGQKSKQERCLK